MDKAILILDVPKHAPGKRNAELQEPVVVPDWLARPFVPRKKYLLGEELLPNTEALLALSTKQRNLQTILHPFIRGLGKSDMTRCGSIPQPTEDERGDYVALL